MVKIEDHFLVKTLGEA